MQKPSHEKGDAIFAYYGREEKERGDFFLPLMLLSLLVFGAGGYYLRVNNPPPQTIIEQISEAQQTRFIIDEPKPQPKEEKPKPPPEEKKEVVREDPVDLTEKPLLNQQKDEIVEESEPPPETKPVRRVYGLKKVYSMGIGASGSAADAIIGKRGNTLDTGIDTVTATDADFKGTPVSITTVTAQPRVKRQVKPEYTKEMLQNRVEGVVRVKVMVDIDGRVKRAIVLDDLGYGSKEKVAEACFRMLFEPAMRGEEPVSTWILIKFRFEMLEG